MDYALRRRPDRGARRLYDPRVAIVTGDPSPSSPAPWDLIAFNNAWPEATEGFTPKPEGEALAGRLDYIEERYGVSNVAMWAVIHGHSDVCSRFERYGNHAAAIALRASALPPDARVDILVGELIAMLATAYTFAFALGFDARSTIASGEQLPEVKP